MGNIQTLADVIDLIRRRFLPMSAVVLVGSLLTLMFALQQPRTWEAYAVLQVELPRISAEVASGDAVTRSAQRLQLVQQELTSRDRILALIEAQGLFQDLPALSPSEKVALLRRSIRIDTVRANQGGFGADQAVSALVIAVQMGTAQQAADVANALANGVLETTTLRQSERARETLEFFEGEEARLGLAIATLEAEITAFKNANVQSLPESIAPLRAEVIRLDSLAREAELQISSLEQEVAAIRTPGTLRAVEQRQIETLQAQIATSQSQLRAARIDRAQTEAAIARAPMVETQLGTYGRRLQQLQDQYSVITTRRAEAETSARLDHERQTERFELLEAALPPDYPLASARRKIMTVGVVGSGMLALLLALALELRNPVLRTARQMERALDLKPVIAIPPLRHRKDRWRGWVKPLVLLVMARAAGVAALAIRGVDMVSFASKGPRD